MKEQRKKKKKKLFNKITTLIVVVFVLILFGILFYFNIIPVVYTIILLLISLVLLLALAIMNLCKKKLLRVIGGFINVVVIIICLFISYYVYNTLGFLFNITDGNYAIKEYNVVVLKDSDYNELKDIDGKTLAISETNNDNTLSKLLKKIDKKIDFKKEEYEDMDSLVDGLIQEEVDAIVLENSELSLLEETAGEKYNLLKTIYNVRIKNDIKDLKAAVNINKEPFNIYISGIDTFGKINSSSRSDVNMVVTVNPVTEKILITWVPRDYYVSINSSSYKDKLTHAGIYGIDSSIYALENLLNIDINYYVKVNFTSVIKVVDLLGGVTVYNDSSFTSIDGYHYKKGEITLDGEHALSYVRERKNVAEGDIGRGKHQVDVLEALMKKAASPSIITKYNSLLKSLNGAFVTNMNQNTMLSFIKKEISKPRNWTIENQVLTGVDGYDYTYTYKKQKLYVMKPDNKIVSEAIDKIKNTSSN